MAAAKEKKREARAQRAADREAAAELAAAEAEAGSVVKSPSDFSAHSYELFIGQEKGNIDDNNREKMSIRSDSLSQGRPNTAGSRNRKVSVVSLQNYINLTKNKKYILDCFKIRIVTLLQYDYNDYVCPLFYLV